jgi:DNA-binding transcriptional LysR family regulator
LHHDCIVHSTPAGAEPWHVRRELDGAVASFAAPSLLAFNDIAAVHQAVLAGLGIANLPTYAVADDLAAGRLISLLGPYVPVQRAIYAIYAASRPVPVNVRAFLQVLEATFPIYRARAIATTVPAPGEPESPAPGALAHRLVRSVDPTAAPSGRAAAGPRAAPEKRECVGGMEALVATVRTGSFAQAGASIGMTSSGVAKAIARLERRLGLQILQRTTRTMHMTAAGELYYKRASRLLAEIDDLEHGLGDPAIAREPAIAASRATTTARARSG